MNLVLNIYKGREIEKTYTANTYDLLFGTIEDILSVVDVLDMKDTGEILKVVSSAISTFKPFLMDIFEGLTEEELRRTNRRFATTVRCWCTAHICFN